MQQSAGMRRTRILFMIVVPGGLVCLPAPGDRMSVGIPAGPAGGSRLSAVAYEKQGMAQMAAVPVNEKIPVPTKAAIRNVGRRGTCSCNPLPGTAIAGRS